MGHLLPSGGGFPRSTNLMHWLGHNDLLLIAELIFSWYDFDDVGVPAMPTRFGVSQLRNTGYKGYQNQLLVLLCG
jgi:hypothetical protein